VECGGSKARDGGGKLYGTLQLDKMKVGKVDLTDTEIKLYIKEGEENGTVASGMLSGKTMDPASRKTGVVFFMFNDRDTDDFDKTAGRLRPAIRKVLNKDDVYIAFEASSKHPCPQEGTELEGEMKWTSRRYQKPGTKSSANRDDYNLVEEVHGESGTG
jgi:hypothetical protein